MKAYILFKRFFCAVVVMVLMTSPMIMALHRSDDVIIGNSSAKHIDKVGSFCKGAAPVTIGAILGFEGGRAAMNSGFIGMMLGGVAAIAVDHWFLDGKNDPNQGWRKLGNVTPLLAGGFYIYRNKGPMNGPILVGPADRNKPEVQNRINNVRNELIATGQMPGY